MENMETHLTQFFNNVKNYMKRVTIGIVVVAITASTLICADQEAAAKILPFKGVALSKSADETEHEYAFGDVQKDDYYVLQNNIKVANELAMVSQAEPEPQTVAVEEKVSTVVTQAAPSSTPVYADPSMSGYEFVGNFLTTAYCPCAHCCGKATGITASGARATANHTIATSSQFSFGTQLVMNGQVYTVEDRGGAIQGNRIDIFYTTHAEAIAYGKRWVAVYRYVGISENESTVITETVSTTPNIQNTVENQKEGTEATTETTTEASTTTTESTQQSTQESTSETSTITE